jgi:hypothetical protein
MKERLTQIPTEVNIPKEIGSLTLHKTGSGGQAIDAKVYGFNDLVIGLADETGLFDISTLANFLADGKPVPEQDIRILDKEVRSMVSEGTEVKPIGDGLFIISEEKVPSSGGKLEVMMRKELGPARPYLPKDKRSRQKAIQKMHRDRKKSKR